MELILGSFAREIKSPCALDLRYSGAPDVPGSLDAQEHRCSLAFAPTPQLARLIARCASHRGARAARAAPECTRVEQRA
jgi:hypothetical protein